MIFLYCDQKLIFHSSEIPMKNGGFSHSMAHLTWNAGIPYACHYNLLLIMAPILYILWRTMFTGINFLHNTLLRYQFQSIDALIKILELKIWLGMASTKWHTQISQDWRKVKAVQKLDTSFLHSDEQQHIFTWWWLFWTKKNNLIFELSWRQLIYLYWCFDWKF